MSHRSPAAAVTVMMIAGWLLLALLGALLGIHLLAPATGDGWLRDAAGLAGRWSVPALAAAVVGLGTALVLVARVRRAARDLRQQCATLQQQQEVLRSHNQRLETEVAKYIEHEQQLVHQANYDYLTKLPNRNLALDRLSQAIKRARRQKNEILVMFIDLDDFKQVNDTLGHQTGDRLLREAAARLAEAVRESDTVARLGGDEFLLICPDVASVVAAETLADNVLDALNPPFLLDSHEFYVRASIGIAFYPEDGATAEQLLKNADVALYRAKDEGRNRFRFYTPTMDALAQQRLALEARLRHAIKRDELHVLYQPIIDLADRRTVGVEALLRWENEALGAVSPAEFIPLAEDTGIIHDLTRWVLEHAARRTAAWNRQFPLRLAINISPREFAGPDHLSELVEHVLTITGLAPDRLELEVTEGLLMHDYPSTSGALKYLDERRVRLSIDDFGTGYSALSYLQRFPFDTLKIDRSFVQGIEGDPASAALVRAILVMAKALGLDTVAEGVETKEQARFLASYGCRYAQGYLFSPPLTAEEVVQHLRTERIPAA